MTRGRCALSTFCSLGTPPSTQMRLQACQYHHRYAYSTVTSVNGGSTFAWRRSTLDLCRGGQRSLAKGTCIHPGGNPGANLESIPPRCHPILVACIWESTQETIDLPLGCLQCGHQKGTNLHHDQNRECVSLPSARALFLSTVNLKWKHLQFINLVSIQITARWR